VCVCVPEGLERTVRGCRGCPLVVAQVPSKACRKCAGHASSRACQAAICSAAH